MNNEQFRRLLDNSSSSEKSSTPARNAAAGGAGAGAGGLLGSRMRSSIPMTPYVFPARHRSSTNQANLSCPKRIGALYLESISPANSPNSAVRATSDQANDSSPPPRPREANCQPDTKTEHNYAMYREKKKAKMASRNGSKR